MSVEVQLHAILCVRVLEKLFLNDKNLLHGSRTQSVATHTLHFAFFCFSLFASLPFLYTLYELFSLRSVSLTSLT